MNYAQKLTDSRWKSKRDEILERDKNKCRKCLNRHNLQVHHRVYIFGAEIWQYPDELLITLCDKCHEEEHYFKKIIDSKVIHLASIGFSYQEIYNHLSELLPKEVAKNG